MHYTEDYGTTYLDNMHCGTKRKKKIVECFEGGRISVSPEMCPISWRACYILSSIKTSGESAKKGNGF
jgi:hypothetical protein